MTLLLFSRPVIFDSLWPHGLQHAKLACLSLSPGVCSKSCTLSWWCHPTISSSISPSPPSLSLSQHQGLFQWVGSSHQVVKVLDPQLQHQSFQWIFRVDFFRTDWFDLPVVQGILKSLLQHHSSKASILWRSAFLYSPTLISIHDHWKNHSLDCDNIIWIINHRACAFSIWSTDFLY